MKKMQSYLSLITLSVLCFSLSSGFAIFKINYNNIHSTNKQQIDYHNQQDSISNQVINRTSDSAAVYDLDNNVIYGKQSNTITNTTEAMVGYDKINKKLVLTDWNGNFICDKVFYSEDFNVANNDVYINAIIYDEQTNQLAVLFYQEADLAIYFNLVDASKNSVHVCKQKVVTKVNDHSNSSKWKLTKSYQDNSYLVFLPLVNNYFYKNSLINDQVQNNDIVYIIEHCTNNFYINKIVVDSKVIDTILKSSTWLYAIRKIVKNNQIFFLASFVVITDKQNYWKIVLFDQHFKKLNQQIIQTKSPIFKIKYSVDLSKLWNYFLIESIDDYKIKITYSFCFNTDDTQIKVILGCVFFDFKTVLFDKNYFFDFDNHNLIKLETLYFNEQEKYIAGFITKKQNLNALDNQNNIVFAFSTVAFDNWSVNSKTFENDLFQFLELDGIKTNYHNDPFENFAAVIIYQAKVYYTFEKNNIVYYKKMQYSSTSNNLIVAWNSDFDNNILHWKSVNKYASQYSNKQYQSFLIARLNDKTARTTIKIISIDYGWANDLAILYNSLTEQSIKITYSIEHYYKNGIFTIIPSPVQYINIIFHYDQSKTPKIKSLKLNNDASKDNNNFQNVFAKNERATVYVHADVDNILQDQLTYIWYKKDYVTNQFVLLTNTNNCYLIIDSFQENDAGEYKVSVEYNKIKTIHNNNIIFKEQIFKLSLDTSMMQSIESVTITVNDYEPIIGHDYQLNAKTYLKLPQNKSDIKYEWWFSKDLITWENDIYLKNIYTHSLFLENYSVKNNGYYKVIACAINDQDFLVSNLQSNIIYLHAKNSFDNDNISISNLNLQTKTKFNNALQFTWKDQKTVQVSPLKNDYGIIAINLTNIFKNGNFRWEFGYLNNNHDFIKQSQAKLNINSQYYNQHLIHASFNLNQKGQYQYFFKLFNNDLEVAKTNLIIDFKHHNQINNNVMGKIIVDSHYHNNAIAIGSQVKLCFVIDHNSLLNYHSYQWVKKNFDDETEIYLNNREFIITDLVLDQFSFQNEAEYYLKAFINQNSDEAVIISNKIIITGLQEIALDHAKKTEVVSPFKIASKILLHDISKILLQNINSSKFTVLDYQLIANDFEGLLIVIPKIKPNSINNLVDQDQQIIKLNTIIIEGFFCFKWLLIIMFIVIILIVLFLTIIITYFKIKKYNKFKLQIKKIIY